jgi:lipopolysaccharide/colanic/teichoic acid biosynthesis glycosyltransferase
MFETSEGLHVFQIDDAQQADGGSTTRPRLQLVKPALPTTGYQRYVKRGFDVVLGSIALVFTLPIMAAVAIALRVTLGPNVLFRQRRVGRHGHDFEMVKFRTMTPSRRKAMGGYDGPERRKTHKTIDDPRHTNLGRLLRRTSLDELPQLVHVVRGEMSLVGPRPELSTVVDKHGLRDHPRHAVRPGLTGTWQITHRTAGTHLFECFDDDLPYVNNVTLRNDLGVITKTVAVVLSAKGM